jgi:hypothetical protein
MSKYHENEPIVLNSIPSNWKILVNRGQNNCGIYLANNKIIKCDCAMNKNGFRDFLKKHNGKFFPYVYPENYIYQNKKYCVMEKMDGDLTDLLLVKSIDTVLDDSYFANLSHQEKECYKILFNIIQNRTMPFDIESIILENKDLLNNSQIDRCKFDIFLILLKQHICNIIRLLRPLIAELKFALIKEDHRYGDNKFDNYAYKIENGEIKIKFLDWESGFAPYRDDEFDYIAKNLKSESSNFFLDYSVNGQYSLRNIVTNDFIIRKIENVKEHLSDKIIDIIKNATLSITIDDVKAYKNIMDYLGTSGP